MKLFDPINKRIEPVYIDARTGDGLNISKDFRYGEDESGEWILVIKDDDIPDLKTFLIKECEKPIDTNDAQSDCLQMIITKYGGRNEDPTTEIMHDLTAANVTHDLQRW